MKLLVDYDLIQLNKFISNLNICKLNVYEINNQFFYLVYTNIIRLFVHSKSDLDFNKFK